LCAATSLASAILLWRGAMRTGGASLLYWSSLCFVGMAVNNVLMYVDFIIFPNINLLGLPNLVALVAIAVLNMALIWHTT
jgi:hypothetical protein